MKESIYNHKVELDNHKSILYNTFSRKYHVYQNDDPLFNSVINNINGNEFTIDEFELLKSLVEKGILVKNDTDEIEKIKFIEKSLLFQEKVFNLTIQPTLDCNFRCVYCYENHDKTTIDNSTQEKILNLVENKTKKLDKLHVSWFGGEPMMRFDAIKKLTHKMKSICEKNHCEYNANIVTNGYLFNDNIINELKDLNISRFQITIDGNRTTHNLHRPLVNGGGTFDKITENMIKLAKSGFNITFRVNVTEENYSSIVDVLDVIPKENRKKVTVSLNNIFQATKLLELYDLYKAVIEKGYRISDTKNLFINCINSCKNAINVEPNGVCSVCSCVSETGVKAGYLNENGDIVITKEKEYYGIKNQITTDREMCVKCKMLPICMGGCSYARYKNKDFCRGKKPNGLSIDDRVKLHYYYDTVSN